MKVIKCPNCKSKEVVVVQGYALAVQLKCKECRFLFVKGVK